MARSNLPDQLLQALPEGWLDSRGRMIDFSADYFRDAAEPDESLEALRLRGRFPDHTDDLCGWGALPASYNEPIEVHRFRWPPDSSPYGRIQEARIKHGLACMDCRHERWCRLEERLAAVELYLEQRDRERLEREERRRSWVRRPVLQAVLGAVADADKTPGKRKLKLRLLSGAIQPLPPPRLLG